MRREKTSPDLSSSRPSTISRHLSLLEELKYSSPKAVTAKPPSNRQACRLPKLRTPVDHSGSPTSSQSTAFSSLSPKDGIRAVSRGRVRAASSGTGNRSACTPNDVPSAQSPQHRLTRASSRGSGNRIEVCASSHATDAALRRLAPENPTCASSPQGSRSAGYMVQALSAGSLLPAWTRPSSPIRSSINGLTAVDSRLSSSSNLLERRQASSLQIQTDFTRTAASRVISGDALLRASSKDACEWPNPADAPPRGIRYLSPGEKIFDLYSWQTVLQETGDGGKVVVCRPRTGAVDQEFVLKIRSKKSLASAQMEDTFRITQLKLLNLPPHIGVLDLIEVLEDASFFYIVMEKAEGGSFFSGLIEEFTDGVMTPAALRRVMREILEAIAHVHSRGMLHRDIKPDNLVMRLHSEPSSPSGKISKVALIDFDHADPNFSPQTPTMQHGYCGTVRFSAPETFQGMFSQASDLYSVGVILYMLITGGLPYHDDVYARETKPSADAPWRYTNWSSIVPSRMKAALIDWESESWLSQPECKDLCRSLMAFDPRERVSTAEQALAHPWFLAERAAPET